MSAMPFSDSCLLIRLIMSRMISLMCAAESEWKTTVSSIRFKNSGRKARLSSSITRSFIFS